MCAGLVREQSRYQSSRERVNNYEYLEEVGGTQATYKRR